jgi:hypothetical protein
MKKEKTLKRKSSEMLSNKVPSSMMSDSDDSVSDITAPKNPPTRKKSSQKVIRITPEFIKNLPEGIEYHDPATSRPEDLEETPMIDMDTDIKENDIVRVGDFSFNIEIVSKTQIIHMRKYLPPEQYRLLKNRKSARLCRRKRKEERGDMQRTLEMLKIENSILKEKLLESNRLLKESENARLL